MEKLTKKEEVIMNYFWDKGELYIKDLQDLFPDPKPHINTISTQVRTLEQKGLINHKNINSNFLYFASVSRNEYGSKRIENTIQNYLNNSYRQVVSSFVKSEKLSVEDLKRIINEIEND